MQRLNLIFIISICALCLATITFAQESELEFTLSVTSHTIPLPKIFQPNIDFSGRGGHNQRSWPQEVAAPEVLDIWKKEIGLSGIYRLQYNLWEIQELAKAKQAQERLLSNYENIIKDITTCGGTVILDIFSTPPGLGKALDKKSAPWDLKAFKELVKQVMRTLSCEKKYNIWYEVWSAPDLDNFFLGRKQDYLGIYRAVAESAKELGQETKIRIPVGGPSVTWWFQNVDGNTVVTPERSLIYELIRFCYNYRLGLDFISWHAYSTDPAAEKQITAYNKNAASLIRDWLNYFRFGSDIPLIIDEWNYDSGNNVSPGRAERANISASYIFSRLKNMYESGISNQLYFCLEDFQNNREGVIRNVGVFSFDAASAEYKGAAKSSYNAFRMLAAMGKELFSAPLKLNDEYVGILASKDQQATTIVIYNYIDPQIALNYISRNIASLNDRERRFILNLVKSSRLNSILTGELNSQTLRISKKVKAVLKKAQELNQQARRFMDNSRILKLNIQNLKGNFFYQRYTINSSCSLSCGFQPVEEKEIVIADAFQEQITLSPYSVTMIVLQEKPPSPQPPIAVSLPAEFTTGQEVLPEEKLAPALPIDKPQPASQPELTAQPVSNILVQETSFPAAVSKDKDKQNDKESDKKTK